VLSAERKRTGLKLTESTKHSMEKGLARFDAYGIKNDLDKPRSALARSPLGA